MQFVDFFAGIGGIRLGLEQAGHKCVGFCEFDKYARTAYKAMYDTEGEWESHDVRTVKPYDVPAADLWCFGFPCQDISVAGKQKGLQEGERSGLFYEIMRLLAGRRKEDRPQWLLIENVKNLLSIGNGFDFVRLLVEVGKHGYSLQWDTLNSKDFGVPQNRERVFIVGYLGNIRGREVFPLRPADGENPCELNEITQGVADAQRIYDGNGLARTFKGESGGQGGKTGLYAVKVVGNTNPCGHGQDGNVYSDQGLAPALTVAKSTPLQVCMSIKEQKLQEEINITPTIDTNCRNNLTRKQTCCAVLTPDRTEKRQNGRRMKEPGEPSFTLTAQDRHGVAIAYDERNSNIRKDGTAGTLTCNGSNNNRIIEFGSNVRIRRLTPRECWRSQGFPDEHFDKAKAAGISDTQLYKQAGNSVSVPVAKAIGVELRRIELCQGDTNNLKITD